MDRQILDCLNPQVFLVHFAHSPSLLPALVVQIELGGSMMASVWPSPSISTHVTVFVTTSTSQPLTSHTPPTTANPPTHRSFQSRITVSSLHHANRRARAERRVLLSLWLSFDVFNRRLQESRACRCTRRWEGWPYCLPPDLPLKVEWCAIFVFNDRVEFIQRYMFS